jgi:hypothetical protein
MKMLLVMVFSLVSSLAHAADQWKCEVESNSGIRTRFGMEINEGDGGPDWVKYGNAKIGKLRVEYNFFFGPVPCEECEPLGYKKITEEKITVLENDQVLEEVYLNFFDDQFTIHFQKDHGLRSLSCNTAASK